MSPKLIAVLKRFGAALLAIASAEYGILGHVPTTPKEWGAALAGAVSLAVEKYLSPAVEPHVHAVKQGEVRPGVPLNVLSNVPVPPPPPPK